MQKPAATLFASLFVVTGIACTSTTDPFTPLLVSGTVTQGGDPALARVRLSAEGFQSSVETESDGTYSLTTGGGGVPESFCPSVRVTAALLGADSVTVVDEQTRAIGSCGEHMVDFDFP